MRMLNQEGKAKEGTSGRYTTCDPKAIEDFPGFGCSGKGCVSLLLVPETGIVNKHLPYLISEQLLFKPTLRLCLMLYRRSDRGHMVLHVEQIGHLP